MTKPKAKAKHAGGRPSGYKPEFATQASKICELGATDDDLAEFFEVSARTIYRWQTQFPEFCQALKVGKSEADDRVERSLFHKAVGYRHEAVKIFMPADAEAPVYAPYTEQVPPDTTAAIFWLKNRRPQQWRDRIQAELTGADGGALIIEHRNRISAEIKSLMNEDAPALPAPAAPQEE